MLGNIENRGEGKPADMGSGLERELEIYRLGLRNLRLSVPVSPERLEAAARQALDPRAFDYVAGGAGGELTIHANREVFYRWRIVPRIFCDVSVRDLGVEVLGERWPAPVALAPVGVQGILHGDAEAASGRAAAALGVPFVASTVSSLSLEKVAAAMGSGLRWFQLYWGKNPELTASLLDRAARAGYSAVVVTLDTPMLGWRERDLEHRYLPFFEGEGLANYFADPVFRAALRQPPEEDLETAIRLWASMFTNTALTWDDLAGLRRQTALPILLKGVLHQDDARRALAAGVDGIVVSNHGGRQVDGAIAALDALPGVVKVAGERIPVLFDSGIRRGADVLKAVALGARAVLVGRLYAWALAAGGEAGVGDVLRNLLADFDLTLALSGFRSPNELSPAALALAPR